MSGAAGSGREPDAQLGQFLLAQASRAGLSARDIAERFQALANQEASRIKDGADVPADPISEMSFSKSHLDRLYKGSVPPPSRRFLATFLEITSRAAGIRPEHHRELYERADALLALELRNRRNRRAVNSSATSQVPTDALVATLQMQLELERTQRTEERLRWALSDTQILMQTLLRIISALRDIITEVDTKLRLYATQESDAQATAKDHRIQAQSYKVAAEAQFDRVNQRRRLLEALWDQAHGNLQRLALHAEATDIPSLSADLALPPIPQPEEFHTQSTLVDIAVALGKVQEHNEAEEQVILELQNAIMADMPLKPDDELNILVAATRLTDERTRRTALLTLLEDWPQRRETRDTLVRLAHDEQSEIRRMTAWSLAERWAGDLAARDALIALARDSGENVRETAVLGLAEGWAGDLVARDALIALARDSGENVRETAVLGLAEGWAGDLVARDALIALVHDDDVYVRMAVAESLADIWLDDAIADTALQMLNCDASPSVRWAAQKEVSTHSGRHGGSPQETDCGDNILLAVRVHTGHGLPESLPVLDRLHRGIAFDAGITVLLGANATGKTVLLHALGLLAPRLTTDLSPSHNPSDLSRKLSKLLEVAWNEQRTLECAYYMGNFKFDPRKAKPQASGAESWMEQWSAFMRDRQGSNHLLLLDEPAANVDYEVRRLMCEHLNGLVNQGSQVIIASAQSSWIEVPTARVIRIDKRALRKWHY
ncbi:HEAT repeat domain-containing protein [Streptomyces sp. NBC_01453]|uniref:HEAT repeat domain-containing protein n=1 Tax=Streptomyces sp. NBC_01453 TaxID=2903873 RepID=UPI002E280909|nr:HEAT repeat domain-containing protein [Streptomyces sp. NBC_01453]